MTLFKRQLQISKPDCLAATVRRPPLRYYGSKWRLAKWIIKQFPPHTCYVEPYGGSAAILLQKEPADFEVYNDLDGHVVTFFRMLRERPEDLIQAIALTPYARAEQLLSYQETEDELEKARRFFVRSWQSFGGAAKRQSGWRYMYRNSRSQTIIDDWSHVDHLWSVAERLRRVQIECVPALSVIKRFDARDTLFLIDPPYVQSTRGTKSKETYFYEMSDEEHRELADCLHSLKGMVVVCGYPSPLYTELYQGWQQVQCQTRTLTSQSATECLWISAAAWERSAAQLQLFDLAI